LLLAAVVLVNTVSGSPDPARPSAAPVPRLPPSIAEWRLQGEWGGSTRPLFTGADTEVAGRYVAGDTAVDVHAVGYWRQRQGSELIYYANRPVPDRDLILAHSSAPLAIGGSADVPV